MNDNPSMTETSPRVSHAPQRRLDVPRNVSIQFYKKKKHKILRVTGFEPRSSSLKGSSYIHHATEGGQCKRGAVLLNEMVGYVISVL